MDHHIPIVGPHVRAWPENDVQDPCDADRHDETDQNERPARQRGGKPIAVLDLPVLRRSNLLLRLIVVLARRGRVRLFVWLRLGGSPLEFGYVLFHQDPLVLCKQDTRAAGCGPVTSSRPPSRTRSGLRGSGRCRWSIKSLPAAARRG